jgi:DNA-binding IclR family transcriptional regulator
MEIVLQLDPDRHVGVAGWVGVDVPLHASAAGKLALAELTHAELEAWLAVHPLTRFTPATATDAPALERELRRVRRNGWAEHVDELEDGHAALSVGVRAADGSLRAAIGISGPTFRLGRARRRALVPVLQAAAAQLAKDAG